MSGDISLEQNKRKIDHLVDVAAVDHVYGQLLVTTSAYVLFVLLTVWALSSEFHLSQLLPWAAVALAINFYRYYLYFLYWRGGRERKSPQYWGKRFIHTIFIWGLIWGVAGFVFFPQHSTGLKVFMISLIVAFSVAFLSLTPYLKNSFYSFALPANGVLAIRLFLEGPDYYINAIGILIFTSLVFLYAMRSGDTVRDAIRLRFENDFLVKRLSEEKEKAEEASRVKTQFLASASHDLRQPVHSLSLLTEALHSETLTTHGNELLKKLNDVTDSLAGLLSSLLDISRLDAGIVKPSLSSVSLENITTVLVNEFNTLAAKDGLTLRVHSCRGVIRTDPDLLLDILRNLLSNAIRYTRYGSVLLAMRKRGSDLLIQVWDTGIGIAESDSEVIFQEFNQLHNPERDRSKGLGLGLAICRRLSKLLGYELGLHSQLGRGTVFELYLPNVFVKAVGRHADRARSQVDDMTGNLAGRIVMVVDDEKDVRDSTQVLLQSWSMRVLPADGIEQALSFVENGETSIDLILADFRLRDGLTGGVVVNRIRQLLGRDIPGVIITGDTAPKRIREARDSGCTILHKPIKPGQLRTVMGKILSRPTPGQDAPPL